METITYSPGVQEYMRRGEAMSAAEAAQRAVMRGKRFDTIAVHGIYNMEAALANQGSIIEPGYFSTSQHFENSDHMETAAGLPDAIVDLCPHRQPDPALPGGDAGPARGLRLCR